MPRPRPSPHTRSVSSHKLRALLAKHSARFFGAGGAGSLLARVKWAVQLKPRPPTFELQLRGSDPVDEGGQRFLAGLLRQSLGLQGVPTRLHLRCVGAWVSLLLQSPELTLCMFHPARIATVHNGRYNTRKREPAAAAGGSKQQTAARVTRRQAQIRKHRLQRAAARRKQPRRG